MIIYEKQGRIGIITLNRPEKRNALNAEFVGKLKQVFNEAIADKGIKVIHLKANGDAFCAGADLDYIKNLQKFSYDENLADSRHLLELFEIIHNSPKVVVAIVDGPALAGGWRNRELWHGIGTLQPSAKIFLSVGAAEALFERRKRHRSLLEKRRVACAGIVHR